MTFHFVYISCCFISDQRNKHIYKFAFRFTDPSDKTFFVALFNYVQFETKTKKICKQKEPIALGLELGKRTDFV